MDGSISRSAAILDLLRAKTRDAHEQLHLHSSFAALFDGTLDYAEYCRLLQRLYGFYRPLDLGVERVLGRLSGTLAGYAYTRRSDLLALDLADLGVGQADMERNEQCRPAMEIVTPASLGGVLYVVEGATLGGSRIDRAVRKLLKDRHPKGGQYWAWCRSHCDQRWTAANDYLAQLSAEDADTGGIISGARNTFEVFAAWLAPLDRTVRLPGRLSE